MYPHWMAKKLTPLHVTLSATVWQLAERRAALAKQLAEIDGLHRQAIAMAGAYGVPQTLLSTISDLSPTRISHIIGATDIPLESPDVFGRRVSKVMELPQNQLGARPEKNASEREAWERKYELIHGRPRNPGVQG